jgi:hypothetical protein
MSLKRKETEKSFKLGYSLVFKYYGKRRRTFLAIMGGLVFLGFSGQEVARPGMEPGRNYRITVPGNVAWTDTGLDVKAGQEISFEAEGVISLQRGNPVAFPCGPDGFDLKTIQQPLRGENIGALIGRIVLLISIEVDEETEEETRNEIIKEFFIGEQNRVLMPIDGSLFLGINELVVEDNFGDFKVELELLENGLSLSR